MSTSGRRINLTAAGDEGYFFTRSNPHASPPTRSTFLPFSSQSPARAAPSLIDKEDPRFGMRQRPLSLIGPSVDDPITRPGNSLSKAFELVDDIEDISATQWEAEASKSSRTGSSQTDAGTISRRVRYSSPDTASSSVGLSRSARSARKASRGGIGDTGEVQCSSPSCGSARRKRKRKRGSISLLGHEALPDTSPVPRLDLPGSSSATSFAHPKTPNAIPSDEAYEWSPSPTPVSRSTKEAARLEDLFNSPPKSEGKIWRGRAGCDETCPDDGPDFGDADGDGVLEVASPHPTRVPAVMPARRSEPGSRPRPIDFDDEPPPVDVEDEMFDEMMQPDPFDEYDLPLDTDLADIDLMDIPALVAGAASASGSGSVSSQSKSAGSGTDTPVGGRPKAIHSNLHRALFGADEGSTDARRPELSELEKAGTPRTGHDGHINHVVPCDLGFSRISDLPPKWQDFYLHHWRRGVDGRKAPRVSRDAVEERPAAVASGPSRAARGKTKATAPRARKRLVQFSDGEDEGDGDMINLDDDDDDEGGSDADTYRDGSQDSFVDDGDDPAAQRAREKKSQTRFNEALSGKRGAARPSRGSRGSKASSAARSLALNASNPTGLGPQEPKGRAVGGGRKRGGWGGKRGLRGGRGAWRGAARGRR